MARCADESDAYVQGRAPFSRILRRTVLIVNLNVIPVAAGEGGRGEAAVGGRLEDDAGLLRLVVDAEAGAADALLRRALEHDAAGDGAALEGHVLDERRRQRHAGRVARGRQAERQDEGAETDAQA